MAAVPYMLASVLAITVMGSFWGLSVQLVTFREQGILRRFRLPRSVAGALLASSILSNYILTLPTVAIEFELARRIFHMQGWGNLGGIFLLVTLGIVTFAALGLIIASVTNSTQETQVINQLLWSAFLFLSGATLPLPMLPSGSSGLPSFCPPPTSSPASNAYMVARVGSSQVGRGTHRALRQRGRWPSSSASSSSAGSRKKKLALAPKLWPRPP